MGDAATTRLVTPVSGPIDADISVPGSKSYTNRALMAATLADGDSVLDGVLFADDTEAMLDVARSLGAPCVVDRPGQRVRVRGIGVRNGVGLAESLGPLDVRYSGTTARFTLAALASGSGTYLIDGAEAMRARPMAAGVRALERLGLSVESLGVPDHLPLVVSGGPSEGGAITIRGDVSSQFLSGLLLVGPCLRAGLQVAIDGPLVSAPYVHMTIDVMRTFGAQAHWEGSRIDVAPTGYRANPYAVEPDASAASYFFAAAAICAGRVRVHGLGAGSGQGDLRLVEILERMGATVEQRADSTEVRVAPGQTLRGIEVDMADCSDVAQTLAMVAVFADGPTTITGIGFIRHKETDRVGNVVAELRRCGIEAEEHADGFRIWPGTPVPATVATYEDHRMAMSFSLLGLRVPGIEIADPGCVAKTFPDFFTVLESLAVGGNAGPDPR